LLLGLPPTTKAETASAPMPPKAREAFDEGIAAARQQQWMIAIRNFLKVQAKAPASPEVLFNLGLAESKVPGRELRAMAWFRAYLLSAPDAPNAEAVRSEMVNLKVRAEGTVEKLIGQAGRLASMESAPQSHYADIAVAQARARDVAAGKRMAAKAMSDKYSTFFVNGALSRIAAIQYYAGDASGAEETIREIGAGGSQERPYAFQSAAHGYMAVLQAADGDFPRAEASLDLARANGSICWASLFVATKEALADRGDQASSLLAKILAVPLEDSSTFLGKILIVQGFLGDRDGAEKTSRKHIENLKRNSFLSRQEIQNAERSDREEVARAESDRPALRGRLAWETRLTMAALLPFVSHPEILRYKLDIGSGQDRCQELLGLLNKQLNTELFTDPESAMRTIAAGKTPEQIFAEMMKAVETTTDVLDYLRMPGR